MFDVIIIGGGVIGCSIARYMSRFNLNTIVLEKENDVCEMTSMANSAIVHSGYDPHEGSKKAYFNVKGNAMFDQVSKELDVQFKRNGSITIGFGENDYNTLVSLQQNGNKNGVETVLLNKEELHKLEPLVNEEATCGLLAPTAGLINPFELTVALMENAMDNGVKLSLNTEVKSIEKLDTFYKVCTNNGDFEGKIVINAAGLFSGKVAEMIGNDSIKITPRKGMYFVLDHFKGDFVKHVLFPLPSKLGKGILVTPTTHGNYLVGPNNVEGGDEDFATSKEGLDDIRRQVTRLVPSVPFFQVIRSFAGERAKDETRDDFIIEEDPNNRNFYHVAGIQSPGLASSLAIGEFVSNWVKDRLDAKDNPNYNPTRRPLIRQEEMSDEELAKLMKDNPDFAHIVCRCERVSLGQVKDVIHRNCGATTVKGVKKRIRPGFGKCQGGFCQPLIVSILAKELGVSKDQILYGKKEAFIIKKRG